MYRFNIPVPPDDDFPEVVVAQRMGEGFKKEYVEYEPRWRFDKRRRAVVVDEKFFYAMAGTAERLHAENAKLRELSRDMRQTIDGMQEQSNSGSGYVLCADVCPRWKVECSKQPPDVCWYELRMRELGVEEGE